MNDIVYGIRPVVIECGGRINIEIKNTEMVIAVYKKMGNAGANYDFIFLHFEDFNGKIIKNVDFNELKYKHQNVIYLNERFDNNEYMKEDFMKSIIFDRVLIFDRKEHAKYFKLITYKKLKENLKSELDKLSLNVSEYDLLPYLI